MNEWLLATAAIAAAVLLLGIAAAVVVWRKRQRGEAVKTNYKALFIIGIAFLPVGIALSAGTGNPGLNGLTAIGVIYMAIGLAHRDKWEKK